MPLKTLHCEFKPERDTEVLRSIKTLEKINNTPAADFWKEVEGRAPQAEKLPPIPDAWFKEVAALPPVKQVEAVAAKLKERNPGFDGKVRLGNVEGGMVTEVHFFGKNVSDLSPVRALVGLQVLSCGSLNAPWIGACDLAPLGGLKLTRLDVQQMPVPDLAPLKGMKLTQLNCSRTRVADLTPLKGMKLTTLNCLGTEVADLSPLAGMPLTFLDIAHTRVWDVTPLAGMKLTDLRLDSTRVSDLTPLKGMPLKGLSCGATKVTDLTPLKGMPLKALQCDFKPERDAEVLRSLKTLEKINGKPAADFWKEVDGRAPGKVP
jgi:hypothetical protein